MSATSQSRTVVSKLLEASALPSEEKARPRIPPRCPFSLLSCFPVDVSQRQITPSSSPEATTLPSCENARQKTLASCPVRAMISVLFGVSQRRTTLYPPEARICPSGDSATL